MYRAMVRKFLLPLVVLLFVGMYAEVEAVNDGATKPICDMMERVLGKGASERIALRLLPRGTSKAREYFALSTEGDKPLIEANSLSALGRGVKHYLKHYCLVDISWSQLHARLPHQLLLPPARECHESFVGFRYYLNYCTYSYSMPFWGWERWQEELDYMALEGVNAPLMLVGMEAVWQDVLREMGYSQDEINQFVAGPAYQAWFLMNNLEGWGGPSPEWWYDSRRELAQQVVARMRELGMTPVLAGYSGMIPHDMGKRMGWQVADPGLWCNFQRPAFLLPTDSRFDEMAERYYRHLTALVGKSQYYSMDLFHEGGNTEGVDLPKAYTAVYEAMKRTNPTAQWVIQGWNENPRTECLETIPKGGLIVLDLFADGTPKWQSYQGHEFAYCMLHNFGGRTGLHGRITGVIEGIAHAREAQPTSLVGIGATPEGIDTNPALYDMLYSQAWQPQETPQSWLEGYLPARYGQSVGREMYEAWEHILASAYGCPTSQQGTSETVYLARPSLEVHSVSTWSTSKLYYEPERLIKSLRLMVQAGKSLRGSTPNYSYDLVDLTRQVLADRAYQLLPKIKVAYEGGYMADFRRKADEFLEIISATDELLGTISDFRLGKWTEQARALAPDRAGQDWLEWNARALITTWGPRKSANEGGLHDYSNRAWAGLLRDYYYPRWERYFACLERGEAQPDWFAMEEAFATQLDKRYSARSKGNPLVVVKRLMKKYQLY